MKLSLWPSEFRGWLGDRLQITWGTQDPPLGVLLGTLPHPEYLAYTGDTSAGDRATMVQPLHLMARYTPEEHHGLPYNLFNALYQGLSLEILKRLHLVNGDILDVTLDPVESPINTRVPEDAQGGLLVQMTWAIRVTFYASPEVYPGFNQTPDTPYDLQTLAVGIWRSHGHTPDVLDFAQDITEP